MATMDDSKQCPVCFEDYSVEGERVPKLLPCTHTVCRRCIAELKGTDDKKNVLACPMCNYKYKSSQNFPENRYITATLKRQNSRSEDLFLDENFEKCGQHRSRKLSLFCRTEGCDVPVCELCMIKEHLGHEVTDLRDKANETREELTQQINTVIQDISTMKDTLTSVKSDTEKRSANCLADLEKSKQEILHLIDTMIYQMNRQKQKTCKSIDRDGIRVIHLLKRTQALKEGLSTATYSVITNRQKCIQEISTEMKDISGQRKYDLFDWTNDTTIAQFLQRLQQNYLLQQENAVDFVTSVRKLKFTVGVTISMKYSAFASLTLGPGAAGNLTSGPNEDTSGPTGDTSGSSDVTSGSSDVTSGSSGVTSGATAFTSGSVGAAHQLKQFGLEGGGTELQCAGLPFLPCGMAAVTLGDTPCLALSNDEESLIEFRDQCDLSRVVLSYSVEPAEPYVLCASGSSTLLYQDWKEQAVHWLDCSTNPPTPGTNQSEASPEDTNQSSSSTSRRNSSQETNQTGSNSSRRSSSQSESGNSPPNENTARKTINPQNFQDMCVCFLRNKQLLVTTDQSSGICAYNTETNSLVWSVGLKLPGTDTNLDAVGVTSDGKGYLFVCDHSNRCVRMLRASDGRYLGAVLGEEEGLGRPWRIAWHEASDSLVVGHVSEERKISVFRLEQP